MRKTIYLDIHALQVVPPSNINRDDTGSPKTAKYGGITRSRVSSQSWKRAIRQYFIENGDLGNIGVRSLEIPRYVAEKIQQLDNSKTMEEALELAKKVLNESGVKTKDDKVKALFFISSSQAEKLALAALGGKSSKEELKDILKSDPAIDIALFGRMVADNVELNEDASCQVAHSISTHGVETEFDFFTAVDDFSSATENAGAGMLGTVEYNSSTLYRYANIAIHDFSNQIGDSELVLKSLKLFIDSFAKSMPTGKVNTFANQTLPGAILISVRKDRPVNLVTAFEIPIKSTDGYLEASRDNLVREFKRVNEWVDEPVFNLSLGLEELVFNKSSFKELLDDFEEGIKPLLEELNGAL